MPKKNSYITVKDQFCGSGGSSQGARAAGAEIKVALNHWKLAIETHNTNFPEAMHDCTDISASDPRRYPSTDILITSPECTNHSLAKGVKIIKKQIDMFASGKMDASAERSRATMWDVPRFAEFHKYNAIIVENVVDARKWVMFDAWLQAMYALGYLHRCVYHNSMHHHPTPQSRDRMYVIFWKKGNKAPSLDYTPIAHCQRCEKDVHSVQTWKKPDVRFGKYKQQYVYCCPHDGTVVDPYYYAAFNAIDWSDIGKRIGDRKKELAPKSVVRIQYGIDKHGHEPFQVINYTPGYTKPIKDTFATVTVADHHAICTPFIVNDRRSTGVGYRVASSTDKLGTITATPGFKLVTPFIVAAEQTSNNGKGRKIGEPLQTQNTRQIMGLVTPPFIVENKGTSKARSITNPLATQTSNNYLGLISGESWHSFIASFNGGSKCTKHITQELGSVTTVDRLSLVNYKKPNIEDCYYRMLKPAEVQRGMAFDDNYIVLGNAKDKVKQLGNAVTPPVMEWLVRQVIQSLS